MNFNQLSETSKKGWAESMSILWGITEEQAIEALEECNARVRIYNQGKSSTDYDHVERDKVNQFFIKKFGLSKSMKSFLEPTLN